MADEVIFYHNPQSRSAMTHWALEEVGAPYRVAAMNWDAGDHKKADYLAINPMGKIPAIQHRGVTVTETPAIMAYLADAFPAANLAPEASSAERGPYYRWLFFGIGCIEPAMLDKLTQRGDPENKRAAGYGSYDDVLGALRGELSKGDYLVGGRFTMADLYIASELRFMSMFGAPDVKGDAVFDAYVARCTDRPAFARTQAPPQG